MLQEVFIDVNVKAKYSHGPLTVVPFLFLQMKKLSGRCSGSVTMESYANAETKFRET
jgi:hypothetical protein